MEELTCICESDKGRRLWNFYYFPLHLERHERRENGRGCIMKKNMYLGRDDTSTRNIVSRQMSCMAERNIEVNAAESGKQRPHQGRTT